LLFNVGIRGVTGVSTTSFLAVSIRKVSKCLGDHPASNAKKAPKHI